MNNIAKIWQTTPEEAANRAIVEPAKELKDRYIIWKEVKKAMYVILLILIAFAVVFIVRLFHAYKQGRLKEFLGNTLVKFLRIVLLLAIIMLISLLLKRR